MKFTIAATLAIIASGAIIVSAETAAQYGCDPSKIDEKFCPLSSRVTVTYDGSVSAYEFVVGRGIAFGTAQACNPCLDFDHLESGNNITLLNNQQDTTKCPHSESYRLQTGDTLGKIAIDNGGMQKLLDCNPQIPEAQVDNVSSGMVIDIPKF